MYRQTSLPLATHYSIDVECVATGVDHNAREVAQISLVVNVLLTTGVLLPCTFFCCSSQRKRRLAAFSWEAAHSWMWHQHCGTMQDQYENVILNLYVRPQRPVVSYLTPLTG